MDRSLLTKTAAGVLILILVVLLGTYLFGGFEGLSGSGVGALIFGVAVSLALGIGLMVAIFSSSGAYDQAVNDAALDNFNKAEESSSPPPPQDKTERTKSPDRDPGS